MAERNVTFINGVSLPVAETVVLPILGSTDQDVSLSALPTAPQAGCRVVRIRGTLTVTAATGGVSTIRVRQAVSSTQVGASAISPAALAIGATVPFEVIDSSPAATGPSYNITFQGTTSAGTGNIVAEIEEVS